MSGYQMKSSMENFRLEKRAQVRQQKCYKDALKVSFKDLTYREESCEEIAQDRSKWRCLIRKGAGKFEAKMNENA